MWGGSSENARTRPSGIKRKYTKKVKVNTENTLLTTGNTLLTTGNTEIKENKETI